MPTVEAIRRRWSTPFVTVAARTQAQEDVAFLLGVLDGSRRLHAHDIETLDGIEAVIGPLGYQPPGGGEPDTSIATWLPKRLALREGTCRRCGCTELNACPGGCSRVSVPASTRATNSARS